VSNVPFKQRWFEDYEAGEVVEFGEYPVTQEEIVEFARRYDPQPFHVDPEAAKDSAYGGLIASGWHTCAIMMRLLADGFVSEVASMGSPGLDELRWLAPVRPGDVLRSRIRVLETRRSSSKPDRGLVRLEQEAVNQRGEVVARWVGWNIYRARPGA
jgi:acyl dehydratase